MQCPERERLFQVLESALRDLIWLHPEEPKLANRGSSDSGLFEQGVLVSAGRLEQEASSNYNHHVVTHGCVLRSELESVLKRQLDLARVTHLAASASFDRIVAEVPSGIPHLDGVLRIQQCGRNSNSALNNYVIALKRFSDFILTGTLPEELNP